LSFYDGSTSLGLGTSLGNGIWTYSTSSLAIGAHSISAQYQGDSNFIAAAGSELFTVGKVAATVTLFIISQSSNHRQPAGIGRDALQSDRRHTDGNHRLLRRQPSRPSPQTLTTALSRRSLLRCPSGPTPSPRLIPATAPMPPTPPAPTVVTVANSMPRDSHSSISGRPGSDRNTQCCPSPISAHSARLFSPLAPSLSWMAPTPWEPRLFPFDAVHGTSIASLNVTTLTQGTHNHHRVLLRRRQRQLHHFQRRHGRGQRRYFFAGPELLVQSLHLRPIRNLLRLRHKQRRPRSRLSGLHRRLHDPRHRHPRRLGNRHLHPHFFVRWNSFHLRGVFGFHQCRRQQQLGHSHRQSSLNQHDPHRLSCPTNLQPTGNPQRHRPRHPLAFRQV